MDHLINEIHHIGITILKICIYWPKITRPTYPGFGPQVVLLKQSVVTKIAVQERREIIFWKWFSANVCSLPPCSMHFHFVCKYRTRVHILNLLQKSKPLLNLFFFFCHFIIGEIFIWPTICSKLGLLFTLSVAIFLVPIFRLASHRGKYIKNPDTFFERVEGV